MHEACSYDMKSAPVIDSLKRAHTRTEIYVHPAPCRSFLWCQERKKTLPQAVQSINTGPGLQTKHTLIIVGQGPTRTSEYMFTITEKKQQASAPYIPVLSFMLLLLGMVHQRPNS